MFLIFLQLHLTIFVSIFLEQDGQIFLLAGALMLLYGIAGAYQPSVQSAIPVLVTQQHVMKANSVINTVNSLSSLTGPVLGGVLYSTYGLRTVLIICSACFFASAVMEIFIHIPYKKPEKKEGIWKIVRADFEQSFQFIRRERPEIGKVVLVICGINLFLSAMIIVGTAIHHYRSIGDSDQSGKQTLWICRRSTWSRRACRWHMCGNLFRKATDRRCRKSNTDLRVVFVSNGDFDASSCFCADSLWSTGSMLFYSHAVFHDFYSTDDIVHSDCDTSESDRKSNCNDADGVDMFTAFR